MHDGRITRQEAVSIISKACLDQKIDECDLFVQMQQHPNHQAKLKMIAAMLELLEWQCDEKDSAGQLMLPMIETITRVASEVSFLCDLAQPEIWEATAHLRDLVDDLIIK